MLFTSQHHIPISQKDLTSFVLDNPSYDQDKPIYIDAGDPSRSYSHRQAQTTVKRLVAGFSALGLKQGDCVLVNSMADIDYSILFHGIIASGGVWCGANPFYTSTEISHHISKIKPRFIFTESQFLDKICPVATQCGVDSNNIFVFDHKTSPRAANRQFRPWTELLQYGENDWQRIDNEADARRKLAAYVMSSGTTGLPKAVVLSHYNLVAAQTLGFDAEEKKFEVRRLLCLPQYATAAIYSNHLSPLRKGEVAYVMPRFHASSFLDNIEKFHISELTLLPPMMTQLLQHPRLSKERLKSVCYAHGGGAAIGKGLQARMKKYFPPETPFTQVYGLSESSGHVTCLFWPEDDDTGSIGRLIGNIQVKLIDDAGNDITAYDTRGEMCIKGPNVMVGYLDNTSANAATFDDEGWLKTGDIAYCDGRTEKWYIVDRKKELIKVNGFQVAPSELEAILLQHSGISDAAIIGLDFPQLATELPIAFVVRSPNSQQLTEQEVKKHVEVQVAKYKRLEGGVFFVDSIPKSPAGKILKAPLRDQARRELGQREARL